MNQRIGRIISKIRVKIGVGVHQQIDPFLLANVFNLEVVEEDIPGLDGCLLMWGKKGKILINTNISSNGRKRFTLAHELGHRALHVKKLGTNNFACSDKDVILYRGTEIEQEANLFAAEILMPYALFHDAINYQNWNLRIVPEMAQRFGVSKLAVLHRIMKVSESRVLVVFSENNIIKGYWGRVDGLFLRQVGDQIPVGSTAENCIAELEEIGHLGLMESDPDFWVPNDFYKSSLSIREQSFIIYNGQVVTVLQFMH